MEIKEAYKLKRFGTYIIEVDSDNIKHVKELNKKLSKICRWRFIKFIIVPMGVIKVMEVKK